MILSTLTRAVMVLAVVVFAGSVAPNDAQAAGMKHGDVYGKWMADCPNTPDGKSLPCRLVQVEQRMNKNGQTIKILRATILPVPKRDNILLVSLPLGYTISSGVKLTVDGNKKGHTMYPQRCFPQGCELLIPMNKDLTAELQKGNTARISFVVGNRGAHLDLPLAGLTKAPAAF